MVVESKSVNEKMPGKDQEIIRVHGKNLELNLDQFTRFWFYRLSYPDRMLRNRYARMRNILGISQINMSELLFNMRKGVTVSQIERNVYPKDDPRYHFKDYVRVGFRVLAWTRTAAMFVGDGDRSSPAQDTYELMSNLLCEEFGESQSKIDKTVNRLVIRELNARVPGWNDADVGASEAITIQAIARQQKKNRDDAKTERESAGFVRRNSSRPIFATASDKAAQQAAASIVPSPSYGTPPGHRNFLYSGLADAIKKDLGIQPSSNIEALKETPWGRAWTLIESTKSWTLKLLVIKPGEQISLQFHRHRAEHWFVLQGVADVIVEDKERTLMVGQTATVPPLKKHRITNSGLIDVHIMELQLGSYLNDDDITRLQDKYDRI